MVKRIATALGVLLFCLLLVWGMAFLVDVVAPPYDAPETDPYASVCEDGRFSYGEIPPFDGQKPYVIINENRPFFQDVQLTDRPYESYGDLDDLGRCTVVCANIGEELMPKSDRESIGSVKPTGWQIAKYDFVDGMYLYNRCHLIGFQLTGENANKNNLITGTRYLNVEGMLPFENMVADYIKETGNHVLYRVTPIFLGDELVARGVLMEGRSVEDKGEGICFNVYCYNVQPGVEIDYLTGDNIRTEKDTYDAVTGDYILNTSSKKFHRPSCDSVESIKRENKKGFDGNRDELILDGYAPCGSCKP